MIHPSEEHYERVEWLRSMGVHVCIHKPVWEARLVEILHNSTEGAKRSSHLYSDPKQVLGTYFRLDLPVLAEILQFEHVLYTDTDVLFRRDITTMQGDDLSLPSTIQLAIENPDIKVLNAGVYVASYLSLELHIKVSLIPSWPVIVLGMAVMGREIKVC